MSRAILVAGMIWLWAMTAAAQSLTGLARVLPELSAIEDTRTGAVVTLTLNAGVPFRITTRDAPARLVVDFSEVQFEGLAERDLLQTPGRVTAARFGRYTPGWSRLVLDLAEPMLPSQTAMNIDPASGQAALSITLQTTTAAAFAAASLSANPPVVRTPRQEEPPVFKVVLDPGHGGIDPGAERGGLVEKDIALGFAKDVQDQLRRAGVEVALTRNADVFVSLEARTAFAHQENGSVFVSIHADALSQGGAEGATVYTLSQEASDAASARLAERHDRADILAGVDLTGTDDTVAGVLLDLARTETEPRSTELAHALAKAMAAAGGPMNRKPLRQAGFSVLKSADIPSVLLEIGFLSSARDRKNLADPAWRAGMAKAVADAILLWRDADAARAQLLRQ